MIINKESIEKVINKSFDTLEYKINNILSHDISTKEEKQLNVQDIIYIQNPKILERGLIFNTTYPDKEFTKSDIKRVPLSSIKPSQFGVDYKNASSEYEAEIFQKILDGELTSNSIREQDFYPILVDEKTNIIIDGNHRYYALSKINSPYVVILYVKKPIFHGIQVLTNELRNYINEF